MVPNRERLSAKGRSKRLFVGARGFHGPTPLSVFYASQTMSTGVEFLEKPWQTGWKSPADRANMPPRQAVRDARKSACFGSVQLAPAPRLGRGFKVLGRLGQEMG